MNSFCVVITAYLNAACKKLCSSEVNVGVCVCVGGGGVKCYTFLAVQKTKNCTM